MRSMTMALAPTPTVADAGYAESLTVALKGHAAA